MTTLRFATFLAPRMYPVYAYIVERLGARLGLRADLHVGRAFDEFVHGLADAGFMCGLPYVQLVKHNPGLLEPLAAPVLHGARFAGRPIYYSDVIVRRGSPFRSFGDLRGRAWAYNDPDSHSGYNVVRAALARRGEMEGFFGRVVQSGYHQRSIELVAGGQVDASAIDCQVLALELRARPELAGQIEIIDSLGPSTIPPVVARGALPLSLQAELRAALMELGDEPEARERLRLGLVERFVPVADSDYDDIRAMLAEAESAGTLILH